MGNFLRSNGRMVIHSGRLQSTRSRLAGPRTQQRTANVMNLLRTLLLALCLGKRYALMPHVSGMQSVRLD